MNIGGEQLVEELEYVEHITERQPRTIWAYPSLRPLIPVVLLGASFIVAVILAFASFEAENQVTARELRNDALGFVGLGVLIIGMAKGVDLFMRWVRHS